MPDVSAYPANFQYAVKHTLMAEGGEKLTNHNWDPGGLTKYGISQRTYPDLDIKNLTEAQAVDIYYRDFWVALRLNELKSKYVAAEIFDTAVNTGQARAVSIAQRAINFLQGDGYCTVDGKIGPATIGFLNNLSGKYELSLIMALNFCQGAFYAQLQYSKPELYKAAVKGWMKRLIPPKELLQ